MIRILQSIAVATAIMSVTTANAAQRTFVATTGVDSNACSLGAPCRSFTAALTHTDPGGEIIVLDSGAYGRVTITKSVAIEAPAGVYAGISVFPSTNGIDVNAPGGVVTLRGLSINGQGGNIGVNVISATSVRVDRCRVRNMNAQGVFAAAGTLAVTRSEITDNGHDGVSANGLVDVTVRESVLSRNLSGAAFFAGARAVLQHTALTSNAALGLYADGGPTATPTTVRLDGVDVSYNGSTGIALVGIASSFGSMTITRSTLVGNAVNGIFANGALGPVTVAVSDTTVSDHKPGWPAIAVNGAGAKIVVSRSVVVDNAAVGFFNSNGALFESLGDNTVRNNNGGAAQTSGPITTIGPI